MPPRRFPFPLTAAAGAIAVLVVIAAVIGDFNVISVAIGALNRIELHEVDDILAAFLLLLLAFGVDQIMAARLAKHTTLLEANHEARTRLIVDTALDAVVTMDEDGLITGWNAQAERTFGWSREAVLGRRMSGVLIPQQYRERHEQGLQHFLKTGLGPVMNKRTTNGMRSACGPLPRRSRGLRRTCPQARCSRRQGSSNGSARKRGSTRPRPRGARCPPRRRTQWTRYADSNRRTRQRICGSWVEFEWTRRGSAEQRRMYASAGFMVSSSERATVPKWLSSHKSKAQGDG
jgi:PAS domain S-box-containing protein